jgi:hypothetical protein
MHDDQQMDQIDSTVFSNHIRDKLSNFRMQYLQETTKDEEMNKLHMTYTKNEYNCQRRHHHNPKTMNKLQVLMEEDLIDKTQKQGPEEMSLVIKRTCTI